MSVALNPLPANVEVRLCALDEVPVGLGRAFEVRGLQIAVFRSRGGAVHAVENQCPHRGGPLAEGMLAGDRIVCPFHGHRYHLQSGVCDQAESCAIATYPVRVEQGSVLLTLGRG